VNKNKENSKTIEDDKRFDRINDPCFKLNFHKKAKLVVDDRFGGMFTDKNFKSVTYIDKYGRGIKQSTTEDLKKYYSLGDKEGVEDIDNKNESSNESEESEEKSTEVKIKSKTKKKEDKKGKRYR